MFRNLSPVLAHRFHVVARDLPGFGRNDMMRWVLYSTRRRIIRVREEKPSFSPFLCAETLKKHSKDLWPAVAISPRRWKT